jgi:hypothetical protein
MCCKSASHLPVAFLILSRLHDVVDPETHADWVADRRFWSTIKIWCPQAYHNSLPADVFIEETNGHSRMMFDEPTHKMLREPLQQLASESVYVGTSSWKYPGWCGQVYDEARYITRNKFSQSRLGRECLAEYAAKIQKIQSNELKAAAFSA